MDNYHHPALSLPRMLLALCLLGLPVTTSLAAKDTSAAGLSEAIEFLLSETRESKATFVRNGKDYTAEEAVEHMKKKYQHFRKKGQVKTPEDFIRLSATRSLVSGKDYELQLPDGSTRKAADWLTEQLERYRRQQAGP